MPQMAPISWLSLFLLFSATLVLFNILNFYTFIPQSPKTAAQPALSSSLNWKW